MNRLLASLGRTGGTVLAARAALGTPRAAFTGATPRAVGAPRPAATPRGGKRMLGDSARSMLRPRAVRNLPELLLIGERNDVHGALVLGGRGSGRTSLVHSLLAATTGRYPTRRDEVIQAIAASMLAYGQCYETLAGLQPDLGQFLRSRTSGHLLRACLFVIDSTANPLWEDGPRCRALARFLSVLKRSQNTASASAASASGAPMVSC